MDNDSSMGLERSNLQQLHLQQVVPSGYEADSEKGFTEEEEELLDLMERTTHNNNVFSFSRNGNANANDQSSLEPVSLMSLGGRKRRRRHGRHDNKRSKSNYSSSGNSRSKSSSSKSSSKKSKKSSFYYKRTRHHAKFSHQPHHQPMEQQAHISSSSSSPPPLPLMILRGGTVFGTATTSGTTSNATLTASDLTSGTNQNSSGSNQNNNDSSVVTNQEQQSSLDGGTVVSSPVEGVLYKSGKTQKQKSRNRVSFHLLSTGGQKKKSRKNSKLAEARKKSKKSKHAKKRQSSTRAIQTQQAQKISAILGSHQQANDAAFVNNSTVNNIRRASHFLLKSCEPLCIEQALGISTKARLLLESTPPHSVVHHNAAYEHFLHANTQYMNERYNNGSVEGSSTTATNTTCTNSSMNTTTAPKPDEDVEETDYFSQMNQNEEDTLLVAAQDLFCCLALNPNTGSGSSKATVCVHPVYISCTKSLTSMQAVSPADNNPMQSFLPTPSPRFTTRLRNIDDGPIITHYLLELNTHPSDSSNNNEDKSILPLHMSSKAHGKLNTNKGAMAATAPSALPARAIG